MITYKEAARIAAQNLKEIYPDAEDVLLEELEQDDEKKHWLITLSFHFKHHQAGDSPLSSLFDKPNRNFKTLTINAENGEFISMIIWQYQS